MCNADLVAQIQSNHGIGLNQLLNEFYICCAFRHRSTKKYCGCMCDSVHVRANLSVCMGAYVCVWLGVHLCVCAHARVCACMCACVCVCECVCMSVNVCRHE